MTRQLEDTIDTLETNDALRVLDAVDGTLDALRKDALSLGETPSDRCSRPRTSWRRGGRTRSPRWWRCIGRWGEARVSGFDHRPAVDGLPRPRLGCGHDCRRHLRVSHASLFLRLQVLQRGRDGHGA